MTWEPQTERVLLLGTGNRYIHAAPTKDAWKACWNFVLEELSNLPTGSMIVEGGCRGSPDFAFSEAAKRLGHHCITYHLDGRKTYGEKLGSWLRTGDYPATPFMRNLAMAARARLALQDGWQVRILGCLHSETKTHGAQMTLECCEHLDLGDAITRWTWMAKTRAAVIQTGRYHHDASAVLPSPVEDASDGPVDLGAGALESVA